MRISTLLETLISVLLTSSAPQAIRSAPPPNWRLSEIQAVVCRPGLLVDGEERRTGTAFVLDIGSTHSRLLVMAQHLFRLPGAPSEAIPWTEMPARAHAAYCLSLDHRWLWVTGPAIAIDGAHSMGPLPLMKDIAAFPLVNSTKHISSLRTFRLAETSPDPGQIVWLLGQVANPDRAGQFLFRATVLKASGYLAYIYDDKDLDLSDTSGAPIVDSLGQVVGVNVAVFHQAGLTIGVADSLDTIRDALTPFRPS